LISINARIANDLKIVYSSGFGICNFDPPETIGAKCFDDSMR
jgi:hypothetical protein